MAQTIKWKQFLRQFLKLYNIRIIVKGFAYIDRLYSCFLFLRISKVRPIIYMVYPNIKLKIGLTKQTSWIMFTTFFFVFLFVNFLCHHFCIDTLPAYIQKTKMKTNILCRLIVHIAINIKLYVYTINPYYTLFT